MEVLKIKYLNHIKLVMESLIMYLLMITMLLMN
nr:MAG TPA: hypothetical protein [Bacteriophage sp.]